MHLTFCQYLWTVCRNCLMRSFIITVPPQGDHIKGDDLGSAFGICATERYGVLCGNL